MYPDSTPYRYISVYAVVLSSPDLDPSPSMNSHLFVVQFGLELNVARAPHPHLCIPPPKDRILCTLSIGLATSSSLLQFDLGPQGHQRVVLTRSPYIRAIPRARCRPSYFHCSPNQFQELMSLTKAKTLLGHLQKLPGCSVNLFFVFGLS